PQGFMFDQELLDQGRQTGKLASLGKKDLLLGIEMGGDFLLEQLVSLVVEGAQVGVPRLQRAIDSDTQCERTLVLMREGDEVLVAKHVVIVSCSLLRIGRATSELQRILSATP